MRRFIRGGYEDFSAPLNTIGEAWPSAASPYGLPPRTAPSTQHYVEKGGRQQRRIWTTPRLYAVAELLLSIHISLSNFVVLYVYVRKKYVRTVTNSYIFSLALTDFLAGSVGIPITVISVMTRRPHSFYGCLFVHLILCILCTISTFHMLAIAVDKYVTICCRDRLFRSRHPWLFDLVDEKMDSIPGMNT
ncbi:hypothetical protein OSTOST_17444, partial [Ostertagia ostertagi]